MGGGSGAEVNDFQVGHALGDTDVGRVFVDDHVIRVRVEAALVAVLNQVQAVGRGQLENAVTVRASRDGDTRTPEREALAVEGEKCNLGVKIDDTTVGESQGGKVSFRWH